MNAIVDELSDARLRNIPGKKERCLDILNHDILPEFISMARTIFLDLGNVGFLFFICHLIEWYIGYVVQSMEKDK
jgi:hypothetical protein